MNTPPPNKTIPPAFASEEERLFAEMDRFDRLLRASNSATSCLKDWVQEKHPSVSSIITIKHVSKTVSRNRIDTLSPPPPATEAVRLLGPDSFAYRHVRLMHAGRVLSDAENWYVPSRLPIEMQRRLAESQTPFGEVITPLLATRETLSVDYFWPSPKEAPSLPLPTKLMRHHALLRNKEGQPICLVSETYTRNILRNDAAANRDQHR